MVVMYMSTILHPLCVVEQPSQIYRLPVTKVSSLFQLRCTSNDFKCAEACMEFANALEY